MSLRTALVLEWYCSMQASSAGLQFAKDPPAWQPRPKMLGKDQESQADSMAKSGTLMNGWICSANRHFHFQSLCAATHSLVGGSISSLANFMKFWKPARQLQRCEAQLGESRKIPESGSDHTLAFLGARSAMQLVHRKVASPPADCPVIAISVATENILLARSIECSWARVTLWPRKQRSSPLQLTGSFLKPWWPVPSQYFRCAMVQSLKQFWGTSLRMPADALIVAGQEFELPRAVLLL